MTQLDELLDEHGEHLELDLLELYGVDVIDAYEGRVPVRRVVRLVERALWDPRSRMRARTLGDARHIGWSDDSWALALLVDEVAQLNVLVRQVAGDRKAKAPKPYSRPKVAGSRRRPPVARSLSEVDWSAIAGG